jgi:nucleotide-binding universal stress UspA family protein
VGDVMVGVDGSVPSRHALRWAAAVARAKGVPLRVVAAWQYPSSTTPLFSLSEQPDPDEMVVLAREHLAAVVEEELGALGGEADALQLELEVHKGPAGRVLIKQAREAEVSMVVVGARGLGGFRGMLLGSVSQQCVEQSPCTVVVIRGEEGSGAVERPARVLLGVDGSEGADGAMRWTLDLARDVGAEVVVAHVPGPGATAAVLQQARKLVQEVWCDPLRHAGVRHSSVVEAGDPRVVLSHLAEREVAGLIVVGTRGLGPLRSLLVGSVASHLVRHASRPVAVVPPKGPRT